MIIFYPSQTDGSFLWGWGLLGYIYTVCKFCILYILQADRKGPADTALKLRLI